MADWIYGIAAVLILGGIVTETVPEGAWRRYIRLFLGVLLILAAAAPLFSLFGISDRAALSYEEGLLSSWVDQIGMQEGGAWDEAARQKQEEALGEPLSVLAEDFGYRLESYSIDWASGEPEAVSLTVSENRDSGAEPQEEGTAEEQTAGGVEQVEEIAPVAPVQEPQERETAVYYEPSELRGLHDTLASVFSFSAEQVTIYLVREGEG